LFRAAFQAPPNLEIRTNILIVSIEIILGLPHLRKGPLIETARKLGAPVLLSSNAFSRFESKDGERNWIGWDLRSLKNAAGLELVLDSAGFVAMARYRGFPWTAERYVLDLAAQYPFRWFSSMDLCVEPEVAPDRAKVLDRVAGTINLNKLCARLAVDAGIFERLMPVIQGWLPDDYLRCLDGCPVENATLIGVGSMCRRHLLGPAGIVAAIEAIDRYLGAHPAKLHLFGLKGAAAAALRGHPRIGSLDSQAYGIRARRLAWERGVSKRDAFVAAVMEDWYRTLTVRLNEPEWERRAPRMKDIIAGVNALALPQGDLDRRIFAIEEEFRELVAEGDLEHDDFSFHWVMAALADND
jgi:hypothetical protein